MNTISRLAAALVLAPLALAACKKKEITETAPPVVVAAPAAPVAPAVAAAPAPAPAVDPANMTDEQRSIAKKQEALDFATMEDKYINDPLAQWAATASGSSSALDSNKQPYDSYMPKQLVGPVDGKYWQNRDHDIGFEWVSAEYAKPVNATEVRLVILNGAGEAAVSKVELQDTDGKWNTIWSGVSDVKIDHRGPRTWFVKTFPKTAYKVKAVKYTVANNVQPGAKEFDAAQLVGE